MKITDLQEGEYNPFYSNYLNMIPKETTLLGGFIKGEKDVASFFQSIPADKLNYAYASNKWNIKDVFQHVIDTERVFQYRCFCIARYDKTLLPGYDQDHYVLPAQASSKSLESLLDEFSATRKSFIALLKSLNDEDLRQLGNANGTSMSARAAAFITLGHALWHVDIIKNRYL